LVTFTPYTNFEDGKNGSLVTLMVALRGILDVNKESRLSDLLAWRWKESRRIPQDQYSLLNWGAMGFDDLEEWKSFIG